MKRRSIIPNKRLLWLVSVPFIIAITQSLLLALPHSNNWASALHQSLGNLWLVILVLTLVLMVFDYHNARQSPNLRFSRQCKDILSIHRWADVTLTVSYLDDGQGPIQQSTSDSHLQIRELIPAFLALSQDTLDCQLKPGLTTTIHYKVRANQRGDAIIGGLDLIKNSPFKLWQTIWRSTETTLLKVYPDFQAVSGYALMASENHTSQLGIKRTQRRGEGMEFHQLREYQRGDTSRQIDWKATARKQKIISRDYQDERDQQIIVLLDNGRRMRSEDEQLGHLDHAVNAMALLSHIALKQGDAVGLMSFGTDQRWLPCKKGGAHINTILNHVYDLQPGVHATDYSGAAQKLLTLQRKRSLVILITNTRDEDIDDLLPAIKLIGKHHLILLANIREPILTKNLERPVTDIESVYGYCGTVDYLTRRDKVKQQLIEAGVFIVDAQPQHLAIEVCNGYLDIKRSGYL